MVRLEKPCPQRQEPVFDHGAEVGPRQRLRVLRGATAAPATARGHRRGQAMERPSRERGRDHPEPAGPGVEGSRRLGWGPAEGIVGDFAVPQRERDAGPPKRTPFQMPAS